MTEKTYLSARGSVHYWVQAGASPVTLVFLHGLTADHNLFTQQLEYFTGKYPVIVWDAPGHGKSRPYKEFSYKNLAEDLKNILDAEQTGKVILIGQSMGGFVAQSFIIRYGERVKGFIGIGTCPYGTAYYSKSDLWWLKQTEWMARLFPDRILRSAMAKMCGYTAYGRENMLKMLEDYPKKELCHLMYLGFAGFIPELHDFKIDCPVCLMVGDHDKTGKVGLYNKQWQNREGHLLHMIKDAAHNANEDRPAEVNAMIEAFLREIEQAAIAL